MTTRWYTKDKVTAITWKEISDISLTPTEAGLKNLFIAAQPNTVPATQPSFNAYQIVVTIPFARWLQYTAAATDPAIA